LLFVFAVEYAFTGVQVSQDDLKLYGKHQPAVYADDVNILGGSVHSVSDITAALVAASKQIGLEVNGDKTEYMFTCRDKNAG
jgi:hypothetical protein